jgi:hypothetical protein
MAIMACSHVIPDDWPELLPLPLLPLLLLPLVEF